MTYIHSNDIGAAAAQANPPSAGGFGTQGLQAAPVLVYPAHHPPMEVHQAVEGLLQHLFDDPQSLMNDGSAVHPH